MLYDRSMLGQVDNISPIDVTQPHEHDEEEEVEEEEEEKKNKEDKRKKDKQDRDRQHTEDEEEKDDDLKEEDDPKQDVSLRFFFLDTTNIAADIFCIIDFSVFLGIAGG